MTEEEPFLKRWARRKSEAKERGEPEVQAPDAGAPVQEPPEGDAAVREEPPLTEADFADVDFEALNAQSDYSRFLAKGVPDSIKYKALRKLWGSDPIFSQIDPFQDYAGDFTDAAVAVPAGTLKTAYRVGKGFLTDEEVAEWEKLGKPPEEAADAKTDAAPAPNGEKQVAGAATDTASPKRETVRETDATVRVGAGPPDEAGGEAPAVDLALDKPAEADAEPGKA